MTGFAGFGPDLAPFFRELAVEHNRDWFQVNRARYEKTIKASFADPILARNDTLSTAGIPLAGDPTSSSSPTSAQDSGHRHHQTNRWAPGVRCCNTPSQVD